VGDVAAPRDAPTEDPPEEGRTLGNAWDGPDPSAGARDVLVASRGEGLVEEEEHGRHAGPEKADPHQAEGVSGKDPALTRPL
jgi:hypothetical protein